MTPVFADSLFYIAFLNSRDQYHEKALAIMDRLEAEVITTHWVLTETADALHHPRMRNKAFQFIEESLSDPATHVVPATADWFERGLRLYGSRGDKDWSLTDCISFEVMRELGLTDALTADQHFVQAGFKALLA